MMQLGFKSVPLGYAQSADLTAATGLPPVASLSAIPNGPNVFAVIIAQTNSVRWRDDGVDPDVNTGMLLPVNTEFIYTGNLSAIKFIQTAVSAKINVSYYRNAG